MGKTVHRRRQSGQATLELTAILTGLIAMTVGLLFVAGMSLSDNRTLLRAKANAEWGARNNGSAELAEGEVAGWNYGTTTIGGEEITMPFTSKDTMSWQRYSGQLDSTVPGLQSGGYSAGLENGTGWNRYQYQWMNPGTFDSGYQADFSSSLSSGYSAARLYHGSDNSTGPVFGFDESGLWLNGTYENSQTIRSRTRRAMRGTFHQWFGVKISDDQLAESPANQVYMPVVGTKDKE